MDLQQWCGSQDDTARYTIDHPFEIGQWVYATDLKACIRCKLDHALSNPPRPMPPLPPLPPVEKLFEGVADLFEISMPWPEAQAIYQEENCRFCDDGRCEHCNRECLECKATGKYIHYYPIQFDGTLWINSDYYRRIKALPNVTYSLKQASQLQGMQKEIIYFRFDGGEGCIIDMPEPDEEIMSKLAEIKASRGDAGMQS